MTKTWAARNIMTNNRTKHHSLCPNILHHYASKSTLPNRSRWDVPMLKLRDTAEEDLFVALRTTLCWLHHREGVQDTNPCLFSVCVAIDTIPTPLLALESAPARTWRHKRSLPYFNIDEQRASKHTSQTRIETTRELCQHRPERS